MCHSTPGGLLGRAQCICTETAVGGLEEISNLVHVGDPSCVQVGMSRLLLREST